MQWHRQRKKENGVSTRESMQEVMLHNGSAGSSISGDVRRESHDVKWKAVLFSGVSSVNM